ncbi:MAG: hypothetical protein ABSF95_21685 [Verrucomicrobiota bacterium]|jgi:hypothetical protein
MKRPHDSWARWLCGWALVRTLPARPASLPADWPCEQQFNVPAPGLVKVSLPVQTLDRARPALEDLRLCDDPGRELPCLIERPRPVSKVSQSAKAFQLSLNLATALLTLATGLAQPLADNPNDRPPAVWPGLQAEGTPLDVAAWRFRKAIRLARPGVQQLELDLDVLSHAQPGFPDLRLLRQGQQLPYILQHTSISRALTPAVTATNDAKDPKLSRWVLKLSHSALPVTRLSCSPRTELFQRDVTLSEEATSERGEEYRRPLGAASWLQAPDHPSKEFFLTLEAQPQGSTLFLETHNGDNPPIELHDFQLFYPATRVLFQAKPGDELFLYYGNPRAAAPRYDLSLVAGQLLAADKTAAALATEEQLKKRSWAESQTPGKGGLVFWGILALVVVVLLFIISRLLPKSSEPAA